MEELKYDIYYKVTVKCFFLIYISDIKKCRKCVKIYHLLFASLDSIHMTQCCAVLTCWRRVTCRERVSNISRVTGAHWAVGLDPAGGSQPTDPWTWVNTLVSNTCQGGGAVRVDGALWLALNVGVALQAGVTRAGGRPVPIGALSIDPAR